MNTKWLIEEQTLKDIADSIREMEGHNDTVPVEEFADRIGGIEPTVEEYMRISDHLLYPHNFNENDYKPEDVQRCTELLNSYANMEVITDGK